MWQAAVAFLGSQGRTTPVARLSQTNRGILVQAAKELLGGVGGAPSSVEQLETAIRYRRSFTDKELQLVRRDWRTVPAIKEDGRGIVLEHDT